jgi:RNA polymerase sigma factor (sigma-70 family)
VLYAGQWCHSGEDAVQEAFVHLAGQRDVPENVVAWLYRVVRNGALNASRAAARRGRHESAAAGSATGGATGGTTARFDGSAEGLLDAREAADALADLPDALRETVIARLWGGLTFQEVAELTGTSTTTAYRRYHAGIRSLRERLDVACPENENPPAT